MKKYNAGYLLQMAAAITAFGLASCEKIIDLSIPDKERKIVVNGLIGPDKPSVIHLSKSLSVLENDSLISITGGDVSLFHGTEMIGRFREDSTGYYSLPAFKPEVGQTYRLTASYDGLKPVEGTAVIPPPVPIISVDTATLTGEWGQQELRLSVKFSDPAGKRNYYGFGVDVTYKEFDYVTMTYTGNKLTRPVYLFGQGDRFQKDESTSYEGKLYFEDLLFDGLMKNVEFGVTDYSFFESDTVWLIVRMDQVDPTYYRYVLSYNAYQQAQGNPFAEPVQVYSNVKDGFGIFYGSSSAGYPIIIQGRRKFK